MDSRDQLHILIVHQPDSESSESGEKHTKQTKTNLRHNRADFRIENQKRKKGESQELDENSKSTLECFSSWCQVLKEWLRCSCFSVGHARRKPLDSPL